MTRLALAALLFIAGAAAAQNRIDRPGFDQLGPESKRTILVTEYGEMIERNAPALNFVRSAVTRVKGGYFIYVQHAYLNQHSFDIGPLGRAAQDWAGRYQHQLRSAGVVRVGIRAKDGEEVFFNLK